MMKQLKKDFNKMFTTSILTSIIFIAFGIFLLLRPDTTIRIISYTIGIILILLGAFSLGKYYSDNKEKKSIDFNLIYGILSIIVGLVMILNPTALATLIPFVLGFWIVINGVIKIQYALELKKNKNDAWVATIVIALLILIWGLILVFNPFSGAIAITQLIGIFIIIYSILDIVESTLIRKNLKDMGKTIKKEIKKAKKIIEEED